MIIVLQILQIHMEDPFVHYMKINGEPDAVCVNAVIKRLQGNRHVSSIKGEWDKHVQTHTRQSFQGARRMLRRPGESLPWQPAAHVNSQPHDEPTTDSTKRQLF